MSTESPGPAEKPPDLLGWIFVAVVVLFAAYAIFIIIVTVDSFADFSQRRSEILGDAFLTFFVLLGLISSFVYFPVVVHATVRKKAYIEELGALKLYLLVGAAFTLVGSLTGSAILIERIWVQLQ